jgi:hypothetical protein
MNDLVSAIIPGGRMPPSLAGGTPAVTLTEAVKDHVKAELVKLRFFAGLTNAEAAKRWSCLRRPANAAGSHRA